MGSPLDSSLEDLMKARKESGRAGRERASRGFPATKRNGDGDFFFGSTALGPIRREPFGPSFRLSPYSTAKRDVDGPWKHDLYEAEPSARHLNRPTAAIETGTKVLISNLDYGVSDEDIKELYAEVGDVKWSAVCYDRSGRSKGYAEVLYSRRVDAEAAVKRYQDVLLDGKPMKVEIKGTNLAFPIHAQERPYASSLFEGRQHRVIGNQFQGFGHREVTRTSQVLRASEPSHSHKDPGKPRIEIEQKLRSDLDADLERYHAAAKTSL